MISTLASSEFDPFQPLGSPSQRAANQPRDIHFDNSKPLQVELNHLTEVASQEKIQDCVALGHWINLAKSLHQKVHNRRFVNNANTN